MTPTPGRDRRPRSGGSIACEMTPIYEITVDLPLDASLYGDKGYNYIEGEACFGAEGQRLIPIRRGTRSATIGPMSLTFAAITKASKPSTVS